jgi:hypothetical protein
MMDTTHNPGPELVETQGNRGEVIYQWDSTPPKKPGDFDDTPDAYVVQALDGYGGCMIHGRYGTRWECNAPARALVLHLINRVKELEAQQARRAERIKWAEDANRFGDLTKASIFQHRADDAQERADAIRHALDAMAKAETLEKQVEFLEWITWAVTSHKISSVTRRFDVQPKTYPGDELPVVVTTVYLRQTMKEVLSWPGELRDGWKHWDKIKEAVK